MFEARTRCYRDSILKELHEMEMGKFLKERSEIVVNLETKISELQEENENFYRKMMQFKDELDVCKMEEIRKIGSEMSKENDGGKNKSNSNDHRGPLNGPNSVGITNDHRNLNGYSNGGGPNSYLPLNRDMTNNKPPKSGIPIITLIDEVPKPPADSRSSSYQPKNDVQSFYENGYDREQRFDGRNNRVDYEGPQGQPAYMYRSQQQHYGPQWDNWGKRQNERRNWDDRRYY